jgi:HlyD family secretion protein
MKWGRIILGVLIVAAVVAITVAGVKERPPPAIEVQLSKAKRAAISRTISGAGRVQAATTVKISSNLSGDLIELNVKQGDHVKVGQVLGKIDRRRFEATMKQTQAAFSAAKSDTSVTQVDVDRIGAEIARIEALVKKGLASQAELEKAMAERESASARVAAARDRAAQASARLDEAQSDLSKTTLTSPIEGTVIELSREVGERVRGSDFSEDVVMTIAKLAEMEVKIEVGEHEVVHLVTGQKADVAIDAIEGQTFQGTVTEIAQKAIVRGQGTDNETANFPVTVTLEKRPAGALPGMAAEVKVVAESRENALVVPVQAVTVRPEKQLQGEGPPVEGKKLEAPRLGEALARVVFVVDGEGKAAMKRVRTGISSDTDIEVLEGLAEGDTVVEGPYRTLAKELKAGDRVEESKPGGKGGKKGWGKRGG